MRRIIFLLIAAALLLGAAPACNKAGNEKDGEQNGTQPDTKPADDGRVHPGDVTLLDLFNGKIAEYQAEPDKPTDHVFICGHRANSFAASQKKIPENSIPCIQEAIAQGVDMVELDVRVTSDGVPMLMHDDAVKNTTNGSGNLSAKTFAEMKALKMKYRGASTTYKDASGNEIQVPTLLEALQACKDKIYVNLDVKSCPIPTLIQTIIEAEMVNQVMIYGYSADEKKECIEEAFNNSLAWIAIHPYISDPSGCKAYAQGYNGCAKLFQYGTDIFYKETISGFGYKCHANGALSYSNSLNYDSEILAWYNNYYSKGKEGPCKVLDQFIASGSDFVQTDYFELAQLYFKTMGVR